MEWCDGWHRSHTGPESGQCVCVCMCVFGCEICAPTHVKFFMGCSYVGFGKLFMTPKSYLNLFSSVGHFS